MVPATIRYWLDHVPGASDGSYTACCANQVAKKRSAGASQVTRMENDRRLIGARDHSHLRIIVAGRAQLPVQLDIGLRK